MFTDPPPELLLEFVRARSGGDPFAFATGVQRYLARLPGGAVREVELDWDEALLADLNALASDRAGPAVMARLGRRLRVLVEGGPLSAVESQLAQGRPARLLLRSAAAELYSLPWALLPLEPSGIPIGQLPELSWSMQWPGVERVMRGPAEIPARALLAWSDVGGPVPWREHQRALESRSGPDSFVVHVLGHASAGGIRRALASAREAGRPYSALHLLAHGRRTDAGGALVLEQEEILDGAALRGILLPELNHLRLVVLAACHGGQLGPLGNPLGGLALPLHRAGAEAVLACSAPLGVAQSLVMANTLYEVLCREWGSLERALCRVRQALQGRGTDWASLQLYTHPSAEGDTRPLLRSPFRGLLSFEAGDQRLYFGREAEAEALLSRVEAAASGVGPRFLMLSGATGVGKTSLLRAGLLPRLQERGRDWAVLPMRPTQIDAELIDLTLARLPGGGSLLILLDPLQELFTAIDSADLRGEIVRDLWRRTEGSSRVVVLACVRVDYLGRLGEISLDDVGSLRLDQLAYDEAHCMFLPMATPAQLERAILGPSHLLGLSLEPGLVELLLTEAGAAAGALPLLQHTLDQLWRAREGRTLTHAAYHRLGGLSGALSASADRALLALSPEEQRCARSLLLSLIGEGPDGQLFARRQVRLSELSPSASGARALMERVLEALSQARLVVVGVQGGQTSVELAHEALIRCWGTIRGWFEEDRSLHLRLAELLRWAEDWKKQEGPQAADYLLRGARLGYALETAAHLEETVPGPVQELLDHSQAAAQAESERAQAELRMRLELVQRAQAEAERAQAEAQRRQDLALMATARARRPGDPTLAAQLLREVRGARQGLDWAQEALDTLAEPMCVARWRWPESTVDLRAALHPQQAGLLLWAEGARLLCRSTSDSASPALAEFDSEVTAVAWAPDGEHIAVGCRSGALCLGTRAGPWRSVPVLRGPLCRLRFAPDGGRLACAGEDGVIVVLNALGERLRDLRGHMGAITDLVWSPEGAALASASVDFSARWWDLNASQASVLQGHRASLVAVDIRADGARLLSVSADGVLRVWSRAGAQLLHEHALAVPATCACWVGSSVVVGDAKGCLQILSFDGKAPLTLRGNEAALRSVCARESLYSLSMSGEIGLVDLSCWRPWGLIPLQASMERPVDCIAVSALGDTAAAAGQGGLGIWRASGERLSLRGHKEPVECMAWSPDGACLATGAQDGTARLWSGVDGAPLAVLPGHNNKVRSLAWRPDGRMLATGAIDGAVRLWSQEGQPRSQAVVAHSSEVRGMCFSPDSTALLTWGADGAARVWPLTGEEPWTLGVTRTVRQGQDEEAIAVAAWSPDGAALLLGTRGGGLALAQLEGRRLRELGRHTGRVRALCWSPAGDRVVTCGEDGGVLFWSVSGEQTSTRLLPQVKFSSLCWGPAGLLLVMGGARVWVLDEAEPRDMLELRCPGTRARVASLDPSGVWAFVGAEDGMLRRWPLTTGQLLSALGRATQMPLDAAQRRRYLGDSTP